MEDYKFTVSLAVPDLKPKYRGKLFGFDVYEDPLAPEGEVQIRQGKRVVGRIVNVEIERD